MKRPLGLMGFCLLFASWGVQSASLLDIYHETMASDPRLLRAEAETAIYQAREGISFGALLPQVTVTAQQTRTRRDSSNILGLDQREYYDGERYVLSMTQPLYDKSRWEAFRSADQESEQFGARLSATKGQVAVDLIDRYTRVLAAEDNYAFVMEERKAAQEQLKLIKARFDRQLSSITDVLSVEARTDALESQELDALNQVLITRENISEMLGRDVVEPLSVLRDDIHVEIELGILDDWLRRALAVNKELEFSRLAVDTAKTRVKQARGRRHPVLSLSVNSQKSDIGFENAQVPETETYVAALNLSMPLYTGGQISAEVSEAKARLRLTEQEYEQAERRLRKTIREAFLNTRSAQDRVRATAKAVQSAKKSYEAQKKGFEYGTVTVVDVLNASETRYEARRNHRQAYYDLMVQNSMLNQVSGLLSPEKIAEIDGWLIQRNQTSL